jgi:excisionase family DNA binding protein
MTTDWMSIEEAATWLGIPVDAVQEAIRSHSLPALAIGPYVRISRHALLALAGVANPPLAEAATMRSEGVPAMTTATHGVPKPQALDWIEPLAPMLNGFDYPWPKTGGGSTLEVFDQGWEGEVSLHGQELHVRIGRTTHDERRHLVVWLGPTICEFAETVDGNWASLIRVYSPDGKKKVPGVGEALPPLYQGVRVEPYQEATGRKRQGVPKGLAVVIDRDDLQSAVHHAAGRWLSSNHLPLEPAR